VNGELRVGNIAETITVTGASPVVDTTNVRTHLTNADDVLIVQGRYGPNFLQALNVLPGRMVKVGLQLDF
jgi:hypothetical protein